MAAYVALLYSIVLGDGKRVTAADLVALAEAAGLAAPRPLLATGNLVFEAEATPIAALEQRLEAALERQHGKRVAIMVRDAAGWARLVAGNPFPLAAAANGSVVAVRVQRDRLTDAALAALEPFRGPGERLAVVDGDLWASFPVRMSSTRLLGAMAPKRLGIGTMRNWNTVRRIAGLLGG